jgi:DNA-binding NtrC family response regulator
MSDKYIILFTSDKNLRQSLALILERAGYKIISTDNVYKALELIKSAKAHLIISDFDLPGTRSILLPRIKDMGDSVAAIILTDQTISEFYKGDPCPNIHYLEKLIAPERLLSFVGEVIGQKDSFHLTRRIEPDLYEHRAR